MSSYKLYYFNLRGSAESSRIIFAQAGVKYEDVRFENEQWDKKYKESKGTELCHVVLTILYVLL